jgi:hypothetical protein
VIADKTCWSSSTQKTLTLGLMEHLCDRNLLGVTSLLALFVPPIRNSKHRGLASITAARLGTIIRNREFSALPVPGEHSGWVLHLRSRRMALKISLRFRSTFARTTLIACCFCFGSQLATNWDGAYANQRVFSSLHQGSGGEDRIPKKTTQSSRFQMKPGSPMMTVTLRLTAPSTSGQHWRIHVVRPSRSSPAHRQ